MGFRKHYAHGDHELSFTSMMLMRRRCANPKGGLQKGQEDIVRGFLVSTPGT
jgi:hypothetical protein